MCSWTWWSRNARSIPAVVGGRGATTIWRDGSKKQTFEWGEGALFSPPLNTWYQHFNGQGDKPVRLLAMTNAPTDLGGTVTVAVGVEVIDE